MGGVHVEGVLQYIVTQEVLRVEGSHAQPYLFIYSMYIGKYFEWDTKRRQRFRDF